MQYKYTTADGLNTCVFLHFSDPSII